VDFHVRGFPRHHVAREHGHERAFRLVRVQVLNHGLAAVQRGKTRFILMSSPRGYVEHFIARRDFDMLEIEEARAKASA
jgi:hypothetical protein